jgi:hypothetical protein
MPPFVPGVGVDKEIAAMKVLKMGFPFVVLV